jgi:hypothetical protein
MMMICSDSRYPELVVTKKSMNVGKKRSSFQWLEIGNEFAKEDSQMGNTGGTKNDKNVMGTEDRRTKLRSD